MIVLAVTLWPFVLYLFIRFATVSSIRVQDVVVGAVLGLVFGALMPVLLIIRTKTSERILSIDRDGIKTTIGGMSGEIPWSKVGAIVATADQVLVIGTSFNFFAIPSRAFEQASDSSQFCETAKDYWAAARTRTAV